MEKIRKLFIRVLILLYSVGLLYPRSHIYKTFSFIFYIYVNFILLGIRDE